MLCTCNVEPCFFPLQHGPPIASALHSEWSRFGLSHFPHSSLLRAEFTEVKTARRTKCSRAFTTFKGVRCPLITKPGARDRRRLLVLSPLSKKLSPGRVW